MKDDAQLIDETLAGDSAAFGQLVTRYQDRLYNTLVHVVGSTDMAYDVVQDAFVQAYVKLEFVRAKPAPFTPGCTVSPSTWPSAGAGARSRPASVEQVREATGHEPLDRGPSPDSRLEQQERAQPGATGLGQPQRRASGDLDIARGRRLRVRTNCRNPGSADRHDPQPAATEPGCNCATSSRMSSAPT